MNTRTTLIALSLLLLTVSFAGAAERVIFTGGHDMMVREVKVVSEHMLEITLLEGGVIRLPRAAIVERKMVDPKEAMEEWQARNKGKTVHRASESISWEKRMKLMENAKDYPVDTGTEADVSAFYSQRGYSPMRPGSTTSLAPYGVRMPTEADNSHLIGVKRDLRNMHIKTFVKPEGRGSNGALKVGDPRIRAFEANGEEPNHSKRAPGGDELRGKN